MQGHERREPALPAAEGYGCTVCGAEGARIAYSGRVRAGVPGTLTEEEYQVLRCECCHLGVLHPKPSLNYEGDEYRLTYNESTSVQDFLAQYDQVHIENLRFLTGVQLRDQVVADFGCGGGSLLDYVAGVAARTIAIEPFDGYHESLERRGHRPFSTGKDLLEGLGGGVVDVALSVHVLEHVDDPLSYLKEIRRALVPGGRLVLATPNWDFVQVQLDHPTFHQFFYRTAHLHYFDETAVRRILQEAGFNHVEVEYQQRYDLSNFVCWLLEGRPTGNRNLRLFDQRIDAAWKSFLESRGMGDVIWCRGQKTAD